MAARSFGRRPGTGSRSAISAQVAPVLTCPGINAGEVRFVSGAIYFLKVRKQVPSGRFRSWYISDSNGRWTPRRLVRDNVLRPLQL